MPPNRRSTNKIHAQGTPSLRIPIEAYSAQVEVAKKQYGGINNIPDSEWDIIHKRTNDLRQTLERNEQYRLGRWEYDKTYRDLFKAGAGAVGAAAGTALTPGAGTIAGTILGTAAADKLFQLYQSYLAGRVQVDSQN